MGDTSAGCALLCREVQSQELCEYLQETGHLGYEISVKTDIGADKTLLERSAANFYLAHSTDKIANFLPSAKNGMDMTTEAEDLVEIIQIRDVVDNIFMDIMMELTKRELRKSMNSQSSVNNVDVGLVPKRQRKCC
jgi:hypothetical protein